MFSKANYQINNEEPIFEIKGIDQERYQMQKIGNAQQAEVISVTPDMIIMADYEAQTLPFVEIGENMYVQFKAENDLDCEIGNYINEINQVNQTASSEQHPRVNQKSKQKSRSCKYCKTSKIIIYIGALLAICCFIKLIIGK